MNTSAPSQSRLTVLRDRWREDSLLRNSGFNMLNTIVSSGAGFVFWAVAARAYSTSDVGLAAALIAAMTLISTVASVGLGAASVQLLPQSRDDRDWWATLNAALAVAGAISVVAAGISAVVLPLVSSEFTSLAEPFRAALLVAGVVSWSVSMLLDFVYIAERRTEGTLWRTVLFSIARIALLVAPLFADAGAWGIFVAWGLAAAVINAWTLYRLRRIRAHARLRVGLLARRARQMLKVIAGQHLVNLGGVLPLFALPLLVTAQLSAADNAYFYIAWKVGAVFFMISAAVSVSLFAEGAHGADLRGTVRRSVRIISLLLVPAMLFTAIFASPMLSLFGPHYADAGTTLLLVLVASAVPDAITNVGVSVLRVSGHVRFAVLINVGMALTTIGLAWVLLPDYGITGAGYAWLASELLGSLVLALIFVLLRRRSGASMTSA